MKIIYVNNEKELFEAFDDECVQRTQNGDVIVLNEDVVLHKDLIVDRLVSIKVQGRGRMLYTNGYQVEGLTVL